jgi:RND family efflux transporter MFP subunit
MTSAMTRTFLSLSVLAAAAVSAAACSSSAHDGPAAATAEPMAVHTATVAESTITDAFEAGGVVQARTSATVAARVMAPVLAVRVAPGDRVRAGQVLVELDGRDLTASARSATAGATGARDGAAAADAEARAAQAALTLAKATHARIAALYEKKSATAQELDNAAAGLAAAEARVAGAQARVQEAAAGIERATAASDAAAATAGFLRVTAPFDGLVTEKLVEPGNMATPGLPLIRLEDTRAFRLEVRVDESRVGRVSPGSLLDVVLEGPDGAARTVQGTVQEVSRAIDAGSRSFLVKIALPADASLRSGGFGRARLPGASRAGLVVPADALVRHGQVTSVFVVADGVARLRLVRVQGTEVLAGLKAGEIVVVGPPAGLTDGRPVGGGKR